MDYDAIIVGGGLSGLTAASLLAKRHLKVAVIDKSYQPGGSCGVFKRKHVTFDQGSAMLMDSVKMALMPIDSSSIVFRSQSSQES